MKPPFLKANEKLPRGAYFYIQVGPHFYAGEEAETRPVLVESDAKLRIMPKGSKRRYSFFMNSRDRKASKTRIGKDVRNETQAKYLTPQQKVLPETKQELTGRLTPKLVETAEQAKKYRRQDLVQNACERLKGVYGDLGAQVSVRYEGGIQ